MSDNQNAGGFIFLSFIVGAVVGGVVGLLFAPKSGKELRGDIAHAAGNLKDEADKIRREAMSRIDTFIQEEKVALGKLTAKEKA
jgi:gas vesicle protein